MHRATPKSKWIGFCLILLFYSIYALAETDVASDSVEIKFVRQSKSGNAFLFQMNSEAVGVRPEQVMIVRQGTKKILGARVLKKEGNQLYLKKIETAGTAGVLKEGDTYTAIYSARQTDLGENRTDSDSWKVRDGQDSYRVYLEPYGGYGMGSFSFGTIDQSSVLAQFQSLAPPLSDYKTSGPSGGLRAGFGKRKYFLSLDFQYGSLKFNPDLGVSFSSLMIGFTGGGEISRYFRLFGGIDVINRLTANFVDGPGGFSGSAIHLGGGYMISQNVSLNLELFFKTFSTLLSNGSSVGLDALSSFGFPSHFLARDYILGLSFPLLL